MERECWRQQAGRPRDRFPEEARDFSLPPSYSVGPNGSFFGIKRQEGEIRDRHWKLVEVYIYAPCMSAWRGQEQHVIIFVTSGGFQAELTILTYLKEDAANGPAGRDLVSLCRTTTAAATTTTTSTTITTTIKKVTKAQVE